MISKAVLATHPRHRPHAEHVNSGWREVCSGEWIYRELTVTLELDGLWHSYVRETETRKTSPGFVSVSEAMGNAMQRRSITEVVSIPVRAA